MRSGLNIMFYIVKSGFFCLTSFEYRRLNAISTELNFIAKDLQVINRLRGLFSSCESDQIMPEVSLVLPLLAELKSWASHLQVSSLLVSVTISTWV